MDFVDISCRGICPIEIIDIECVLLSFFSENFVSTKWRIYKGIFGSSRLLREGISRGREECDCFFCQTKFAKRYKFKILNGKMIYKRKRIFWGFYEEKVSPELTIQRNWIYKTQVFKVAAKAEKDKTQKQTQRTKTNLIR